MTIAAAIRPEKTSVTFKLNSAGTGATQTIIAEGAPHIINVDANLDTAIFFEGAEEGNPNFQNININARIETDTSDDLFEKLQRETERRCPVYQLFSRSGVNIRSQWIRQAS